MSPPQATPATPSQMGGCYHHQPHGWCKPEDISSDTFILVLLRFLGYLLQETSPPPFTYPGLLQDGLGLGLLGWNKRSFRASISSSTKAELMGRRWRKQVTGSLSLHPHPSRNDSVQHDWPNPIAVLPDRPINHRVLRSPSSQARTDRFPRPYPHGKPCQLKITHNKEGL